MSKAEAPGYVGPYRLLNVVNTGQTTQFWQAIHDGKQQFFGLKLPLDKCRKDREQIGYLKWEYAVGAKLHHPNIIQVVEYGTDRGMAYLAMEWFSAPNMKNWIRQGRREDRPADAADLPAGDRGAGLFQHEGLGPPRHQARQLPGLRQTEKSS